MDKYSTLGMLCKREIKNHSEKLCVGLSRPKQKLVGQVLYGLLHGQSCRLTEIGRALKEKIALKKTVERLRLGLFHVSHEQREQLMENHLSQVRAYDALAYYEYFFSHKEPFVIRCKKNRDVVYKGKTQNILALANTRKGKYRLDYQTKNGRKCCCKVSFASFFAQIPK